MHLKGQLSSPSDNSMCVLKFTGTEIVLQFTWIAISNEFSIEGIRILNIGVVSSWLLLLMT